MGEIADKYSNEIIITNDTNMATRKEILKAISLGVKSFIGSQI